MPRWYKGFECRGNKQNLLNQLRHAIKNNNLGRFLPVARVEKGGKGGRFCLFLAVESDVRGEFPKEAQSILNLYFLKTPFTDPFTLEQIKKMSIVGAESRVEDYVPRLPYRPLPTPQQDDPFEAVDLSEAKHTDESSAEETEKILVRTQALDRLLLWLSAKGQGSWNLFRGACQALGLGEDGHSTGSIARSLRLLGHIEFSSEGGKASEGSKASDGKKWSIAPTVLVKSDFGQDDEQYILSGQRHPTLLQALRKLAHLEELPQPEGNGPATIRIWTDKVDRLLTTLSSSPYNHQFHNGGKVANQLARLLPSCQEWMNSLEELPNVMPELSRLKRFTGKSFSWGAFDRKSGLYEFWELESDKSSRPKYTYYYDAKRKRWLRGDWYGLRFLALQADGTPCPVNYDQTTGRLAILDGWRWPELYERVLVLASGRLPERHNGWLRYEGISPQTLDELRLKLKLEIEE